MKFLLFHNRYNIIDVFVIFLMLHFFMTGSFLLAGVIFISGVLLSGIFGEDKNDHSSDEGSKSKSERADTILF